MPGFGHNAAASASRRWSRRKEPAALPAPLRQNLAAVECESPSRGIRPKQKQLAHRGAPIRQREEVKWKTLAVCCRY